MGSVPSWVYNTSGATLQQGSTGWVSKQDGLGLVSNAQNVLMTPNNAPTDGVTDATCVIYPSSCPSPARGEGTVLHGTASRPRAQSAQQRPLSPSASACGWGLFKWQAGLAGRGVGVGVG